MKKNPFPKFPKMKQPRHGYRGNPMPAMVRDINRTALGVVGIGAMTTLGVGALNAIKP